MTLTWKEKPKYDVHGPEPDRWDLELAPIDSQSRAPIIRQLNLDESHRREKEFGKMCLLWVKRRHDEFLETEDPPISPIPFSVLAAWHQDFRLEDDHVGFPLVALPVRPWVAALAARRRASAAQLRALSPWHRAMPLMSPNSNDVSTPRRSISMLCTPLRRAKSVMGKENIAANSVSPPSGFLSTSGIREAIATPVRNRRQLATFSENGAIGSTPQTPVRSSRTARQSVEFGEFENSPPLALSSLCQTPPRNNCTPLPNRGTTVDQHMGENGIPPCPDSSLRTPYTALAKLSLSSPSTPFTSRSANKYSAIPSPYRGRSPWTNRESALATGDTSRMTPDHRRIWSRTKSKEREKNIAAMLQDGYDSADCKVREKEDCVKCFQECIALFLRSNRSMLQIPALCKQICQKCIDLSPERVLKAIEEVAVVCPEVLRLTESKVDAGQKVVNFQRDANFVEAKDRLRLALAVARQKADKTKSEILQQYVPEAMV
eukprot:CAMPEP_0113844826 /NCGR_PEP_ID=MMETSP0372-20130328/436_1 /TAXON_ID=340204 /ORGANISM="Lankesteria abbotti" /LENGTH=488 /DNA_ID=CAMNT_0000813839 /DNA_START=137 /DNA_END=1603 /DNA_ORIENTATION=- /assembly_acc=CAM_ASM_000359